MRDLQTWNECSFKLDLELNHDELICMYGLVSRPDIYYTKDAVCIT